MLTCFGPLSRNFQLGEKIAKGERLEDVVKHSRNIIEGVETTRAPGPWAANIRSTCL
jgi:glycerol-3-phosphate dehydrogenase (NAD(P)+)